MLAADFGAERPADLGPEDFAMFVHQAHGDADPAGAYAALLERYRRLAARDEQGSA